MKYAIGLDLGGSSIKYGLVSNEGTIVKEGKIPSYADKSAEEIISQLLLAVDTAIQYAKENNMEICGIGIGTPGIVDEKNGIVLGGAENLAEWENIPLAKIVKEHSGLDTYVNNDANVMGLAEARFGAAKGCTDVVFLTVGTGIGGAVIINGKLYGGYQNRGTELGHFPFVANGEPCACGSVGCLETYASAAAMVKRYRKMYEEKHKSSSPDVDGEHIINLYKSGDDTAIAAINENCSFLGHAIAGFINIFSPQKVIVGGGLTDAGEFYIDKIREETKLYVMSDCAVNTTIERAVLGNKAGFMGAAGLCFVN
ncbi:glucokinase [Dysgonomonas sp. PFB1-18]|uniref:ROK family protein n=1 Tax=unclassified Dysgonomonas TaxID=2630389 RepID=UPI002475DF9F|nr:MULTISPECIES: ROK family protein [unclassified Dysgonomonas]MDH6308917.1 glucokinase [Dysgonomonas sp. PF1-14]MDH6338668.1 glucokinase [Dysgonomonas sp. PF1-16]MDH6380304.1 glucokinase [Dysgonomonas sp. PFB1-18]MDH6397634.1 glucokinase [Dysgonomonas sp. PF1-23]